MTKNCNTIKNTCGSTNYATCIHYESDVNEQSSLVENTCLDLEKTTEDQYQQLEKIWGEINLSELGESCLEYVQEGGKNIVKNVLKKYEEEICTLKQKVEELETTAFCDKSITECDLDFKGLVDSCGNGSPQTVKDFFQFVIDNLPTE